MHNKPPIRSAWRRIKILACTLFLLFQLAPTKTYAQFQMYNMPFDPLATVNGQLRGLFSPLWHPVPEPYSLYEMSAHMVDSVYWTDNHTDTVTRDIWFGLYKELRTSAFDTNDYTPMMDVLTQSLKYHPDSVVLNILAYDYLTFDDSALTTDDFYDFDTVDNIIVERYNGEGPNPFITKSVFAVAPSLEQLPSNTVTWVIDPAQFFHDDANDFAAMGDHLHIDFGDGTGFHDFSLSSKGFYTAVYTVIGVGIGITAQIGDAYNNIKKSVGSVIYGTFVKPAPVADWIIDQPGLTAGVYEPCNSSGQPLAKTIIYLEGYDPMDAFPAYSRTVQNIYGNMIMSEGLSDLRNFGYTYVVVDWKNSNNDIRANAAELVTLLNNLKCHVEEIAPGNQFVIMAESMGGLVARYAMCFMEQFQPGPCVPEKMHNTRLLITLDSPHEGANIPLAYQHTYRGVYNLANYLTVGALIPSLVGNAMLDGTSVKQMLIYHEAMYNASSKTYPEHGERTSFKSDLAGLGNYPQYCKMFAMSNGSIEGHGQTRYYDGAQRTPNDHFLDMSSEMFVNVLKNELKVMEMGLELNSAPSGTGNILDAYLDLYTPEIRIKVKLIPRWPWPPRIKVEIKVSSNYSNTVSSSLRPHGLKPYDVAPGGNQEFTKMAIGSDGTSVTGKINALIGGSPTYDPNTHSWTVTKKSGFFGTARNARFYTDGLGFCFVPTVSALGIQTNNLYTNVAETSMGSNMSITPFDVITGFTENNYRDGRLDTLIPPIYLEKLVDYNVYKYNRDHLQVRNDSLKDWQNGARTYTYNYYKLCEGSTKFRPKQMLNREIGDDTLIIENREAGWSCLYDAELYIGVNERSEYYEYPSTGPQTYTIPGIYSREDDYVISVPQTTFKTRPLPPHNTPNIVVNAIPDDQYVIEPIEWYPCCNTYGLYRSASTQTDKTSQGDKQMAMMTERKLDFVAYPNPLSGSSELNINFYAITDRETTITLFDIMGRKVQNHTLSADIDGNINYKMRLNNIPPGTYILSIQNNGRQLKQRIVIAE